MKQLMLALLMFLTLGACSSSHEAAVPTSTTTSTATSRHPSATINNGACISATRLFASVMVRTHASIPAVPDLSAPFYRLLNTSLSDCASRSDWLTAARSYAGPYRNRLDQISQAGCDLVKQINVAEGHTEGGRTIPVPAACR
jgi:hypothetical protein